MLVEIGGTVGDIESLPFVEAIRQLRQDVGPREHALHPPDARAVHRRRRRAEDQADAAQRPRPARDRHPARHPALPHRSPPRSGHQAEDRALLRRRRGSGHHREGRLEHLRGAARARPRKASTASCSSACTCRAAKRGWTPGSDLVDRIKHPSDEITIHVVGKYVGYEDSYKSLNEALYHGGFKHRLRVNIRWVEAEALEQPGGEQLLDGADGILVPGGFGDRGTRGMMRAAEDRARARHPLLRHLLRLPVGGGRIRAPRVRPRRRRLDRVRAGHARQGDLQAARSARRGRPRRHDAARLLCLPAQGRIARRASSTASDVIQERHRHRYEFNCLYEKTLDRPGAGDRRPLARRQVRRDRRAAVAPVVRRGAVPSRVQVEAAQAASALRRIRGAPATATRPRPRAAGRRRPW